MAPYFALLMILKLFSVDASILCLTEHHIAHPILIGAFNIRVFGKSKMKKPEVVQTLVQIIRRYDVILIQEIRDVDEVAFPKLLAKVNSQEDASTMYNSILSPRLGKSSMKEQYGLIYRQNLLEVVMEHVYPDMDGVFERPPFIITLRRINSNGVQQVFNIMSLHAKPSSAVAEMNAVDLAYEHAVNKTRISDTVIAGDLNADCDYVCNSCWERVTLRSNRKYEWLIGDEMDTTVYPTDCAYDRILVAGNVKATGFGGKVYKFDSELGLSKREAYAVSDHYPVEFTMI